MTPPEPPAEALTRDELRRYSRPLLVPEWQGAGAQERLRAARVLVVGAGGLGCPVVAALAGAGVGTLVISDGDEVSLSNLHRQGLYTTADVGRSKAEAAAARAQAINPHVRVQTVPALETHNADALVAEADLVIDATDNFETRYLLADACVRAGREWVWGAAAGTAGMLSVFGPDLGLRDVFPTPGDAASCDEIGVLGPLPAMLGNLMALEALKVLGAVGEPLRGRLVTFDALGGHTRQLTLRRAISPAP